METIYSFLRRYAILLALLLVIVIIAGFYLAGFRVGPGGVQRVGVLTLSELPADTKVYVDQTLKTTSNGQRVKFELVPGSHSIIVDAPNEYPWSSIVKVASGHETTIDPFLVATKVSVTPLTGDQQKAALAAIASSTLPTEAAPLHLANGCATLYVSSDNQLIEDAASSTPGCTPPAYLCLNGSCAPTIIFAPVAPLTFVAPFPGRQDALLVAFAGSLYALAVDPTNPQFFAPLVRSANPKFGITKDGSLVVQQGQTVSKIGL